MARAFKSKTEDCVKADRLSCVTIRDLVLEMYCMLLKNCASKMIYLQVQLCIVFCKAKNIVWIVSRAVKQNNYKIKLFCVQICASFFKRKFY